MPTESTSLPVILVIEDDESILRLIHRLVLGLKTPCTTITIPNGATALAEVARRPVALVITDYLLPGTDGLQLTAAIKAASPATHVVVISGMDTPALAAEARAAGAGAFLAKPFPLAEFRAIVEAALGPPGA
jgi:two-component system, response regulator, stage 0 sporulation protein F